MVEQLVALLTSIMHLMSSIPSISLAFVIKCIILLVQKNLQRLTILNYIDSQNLKIKQLERLTPDPPKKTLSTDVVESRK